MPWGWFMKNKGMKHDIGTLSYIEILALNIFYYIYIYIYISSSSSSRLVYWSDLSLSLFLSLSLSLSLAIRRYHQLFLAGFLECILCQYTVDVCKSLLVGEHCCVYKRTSLMSSSFFLKQFRGWLLHLTWIACEMGGKWPYISCFVGCCFQDLFKTTQNILG